MRRRLSAVSMLTIGLTTILILGRPELVSAGTDIWTSNGPVDDIVLSMAFDPAAPGTVYAGTTAHGVYKSADGGGSWAPVNTGMIVNASVADLAVDPSAPSTLYAATDGLGVYRSFNAGGNWSQANTGLPSLSATCLAVDPASPGIVYAGIRTAGVFKTTDGGEIWNPVNDGLASLDLRDLAMDPSNPSTLYAATDSGGIFKSTDAGASWLPAGSGLADPQVYALAVDPSAPAVVYAGTHDGVYRSTDGGGTWNPANAGLPDPSVRAIAVHPRISSMVYAGTARGVYISLDDGGSWSEFNAGLGENSVVWSLAVDPSDPALVFAGVHRFSVPPYPVMDAGVAPPAASSGVYSIRSSAPGPFAKTGPASGGRASADPTLSWNAGLDAALYEYCVDSIANGRCDAAWIAAGDSLSADVSGLADGTTYSWQVRAVKPGAFAEADGGVWWSFTAHEPVFADVPVDHPFWSDIEAFYNAGITSGCGVGPLVFCPENDVTRAAAAIFLLRARHGDGYAPPAATHFFADLPVAGKEWQEAWVDQAYREGITAGCGTGPLRFCPENPVTRAAMAVFLLRALEGSSYAPPAASHFFADLPVAGKEWMEPWADEVFRRGITTGCGTGPLIYCPENPVKRQAMAAFIVRAFNLPLP